MATATTAASNAITAAGTAASALMNTLQVLPEYQNGYQEYDWSKIFFVLIFIFVLAVAICYSWTDMKSCFNSVTKKVSEAATAATTALTTTNEGQQL